MTDLERYLYQYTDAHKQLNKLCEGLIEAIRTKDDAYIPPNMAIDPTKARVQKSNVGSQVERAVILIVDKYWEDIEEIQRKMLHYRTIINQIDQMMLVLDKDERDYIRYKYFEDKSGEQICSLMYVGSTKRKDIRKSALEALQAQYETICGKARQTYNENTETA